MAGWRVRLFAWLARRQPHDALTLGLPPDRVVVVEEAVESE